jgi:anti-sigma regulatory factor (Ser/Thr protein kinase)
MTGAAPHRRTTQNQPPHAAVRARPGRSRAVALDLQFDARNLFTLRSAIAAHAAALVAAHAAALVDADAAEEMVLVAHELATNAVRHGGGSGRLRLWAAEGRLWCEVSDRGRGLPDPASAGTRLPDPATPGGRGLWIARTMSELTIATGSHGTTITAAIPHG